MDNRTYFGIVGHNDGFTILQDGRFPVFTSDYDEKRSGNSFYP